MSSLNTSGKFEFERWYCRGKGRQDGRCNGHWLWEIRLLPRVSTYSPYVAAKYIIPFWDKAVHVFHKVLSANVESIHLTRV